MRPCYGAGVRSFWRTQEARLVAEWPTNAETGAAWTRWHRTEFGAYVEALAGRQESPSPFAERSVDAAKRAFDGVEDESSLKLAKTKLQSSVGALYAEAENQHDDPMPVITFFAPIERGPRDFCHLNPTFHVQNENPHLRTGFRFLR